MTPIGTRARARPIAAALGLVVASWPALAVGAPFELAWSAPAACPSREQIVEATRARLGEAPSEAPPELLVQGTVVADGGGFIVRLALTDAAGRADGEREVRVERGSCSEIEAPTSLVLAMMIAVARPQDATHEESKAMPETRPPVVPPRRATEAPMAPAPAAAGPHRLVLGATTVGTAGILPSVGLGFGLRAAYSPGLGIVFGLEATFEGSRPVRVAGGEVGFQLFTASARVGMLVLQAARFELIPTVGARGVGMRTTPTGFSAVHDEIRSTVLAGPGLLARVKLAPRLFVEVLPEIEGVFVRDRFRIREADKLHHIHRAAPFEGRLSAGIAYEL